MNRRCVVAALSVLALGGSFPVLSAQETARGGATHCASGKLHNRCNVGDVSAMHFVINIGPATVCQS